MKKYLIIGGSYGIANERIKLVDQNGDYAYVISKTKPDYDFKGEHFSIDVLVDELPEFSALDGIVYAVGTINLKPFSRLTMSDFQNYMNVNFYGALRVVQQYLATLKTADTASVVLFSSVAAQR